MAGFGGAVKLTGESAYKKALADINKSLKETSADLKLVTTMYDSNDKSLTAVTAKEEALNNQLDAQEKKAKTLTDYLNSLKASYESNSKAHEELVKSLQAETEKLSQIESAYGKNSKEYEDQAKKVSDLTTQVTKSTGALDKQDAEISKVSVDLTNITTEIVKTTQAQDSMKKSSEGLADKIGREEKELGNLKQAYIEAVAQYGKNSTEAKTLGSQISSLSGELSDNKEAYSKASAEADKLDKSIENSGKSAEKASSGGFTVLKAVVADLAGSAIKSALSGLKDLGSALVSLGKDSISSYADFEQLEGGIAKLFGTGGQSLEEFKKNAKATAKDIEDSGINWDKYADTAWLSEGGGVGSLFEEMQYNIEELKTSSEDLEEYLHFEYELDTEDAKKAIEAYYGAVTDEKVQKKFEDMGKAQEKVLENAQNAYKTSGLSANEYMETVTNFSASLISGLGDDTLKASEYADMAIRDMSDNANTFGTDISSIQNAYQGFAKGNFTMLDNLKLGYGGTKEEMLRLVKEAGVVDDSVESINDVSFDKIILGINKTQERMKITGTTAKEADKTISGSVNTMKASWKNLMTSIASGNGDLKKDIEKFVESAKKVVNNILPVAKNVISGIFELGDELITNTLPDLIDEIPPLIEELAPLLLKGVQGILDGINKILPDLLPVIQKLISDTLTMLSKALPDLLKSGCEILKSIIKGIADTIPDLIKMLPEVLKAITDTLLSKEGIEEMLDIGLDLLTGIIDGITETLPALIEMLPEIIETIATTLTDPENIGKLLVTAGKLVEKICTGIFDALGKIATSADDIISKLIEGIKTWFERLSNIGGDIVNKIKVGIESMKSVIFQTAYDIGSKIVGAIKDFFGKIKDAGEQLMNGLRDGMEKARQKVINKSAEVAFGIYKKIKDIFGIHSPSRLMRDRVGKFIALGLGEGFSDEMKTVSKEMADAVPTTFDVETKINNSKKFGKNGLESSDGYNDLVKAFKEALEGVEVDMNGVKMGKFVRKTVTDAIYN